MRGSIRRLSATVFWFVCCFVTASAVQAQTLTVPQSLSVHDKITITYSDPSKGGTSVQIEITDDGVPTPQTVTLTITLDSDGNGTATWNVPNWNVAKFNAPNVPEQTRVIT